MLERETAWTSSVLWSLFCLQHSQQAIDRSIAHVFAVIVASKEDRAAPSTQPPACSCELRATESSVRASESILRHPGRSRAMAQRPSRTNAHTGATMQREVQCARSLASVQLRLADVLDVLDRVKKTLAPLNLSHSAAAVASVVSNRDTRARFKSSDAWSSSLVAPTRRSKQAPNALRRRFVDRVIRGS